MRGVTGGEVPFCLCGAGIGIGEEGLSEGMAGELASRGKTQGLKERAARLTSIRDGRPWGVVPARGRDAGLTNGRVELVLERLLLA